MKNLKYEFINPGITLPFAESAALYAKSEFIGSTDDGWSEIIKVNNKYYHVQQGLQEYEGHIYMSEVKLFHEENPPIEEDFNPQSDKDRAV